MPKARLSMRLIHGFQNTFTVRLRACGWPVLLVALLSLLACNHTDSSHTTHPSSAQAAQFTLASQASDSGPDRCALLTDDEVRDAIGPHRAGISDVSNEW